MDLRPSKTARPNDFFKELRVKFLIFAYMIISWVAIGAAVYRSFHTPEPRNPQKVSKGGSRASRPGVSKKVSKKSQMTQKRAKKTTKSVFGDFFDTFLTLRAGRPGKSFLRLFGDFGARGCGDSCIWGLHTQFLGEPEGHPQGHREDMTPCESKRRTNVQQLTCKIDSSNSFYYLFLSFIILELKPLVLKGKVRGEKL